MKKYGKQTIQQQNVSRAIKKLAKAKIRYTDPLFKEGNKNDDKR